jgi:hypothetical protein
MGLIPMSWQLVIAQRMLSSFECRREDMLEIPEYDPIPNQIQPDDHVS